MLKIVLIKITDELAKYRFFPEGKSQYGELAVSRLDGNIEIIKKAENDEFNRYLHHAVEALDRYFKNDTFLESETIAWY